MNILMALSQLEVTGAEVYGTVLSDELIKRGNTVHIVSDTLTKPTNATYEKIEFNKRSFTERWKQVSKLLKIIKERDIHIVHAHSRASSWSCSIACKIAKIPLITTVHGRQPVHMSRKVVKGFGDYSFAVCENIEQHLIRDLGVCNKNIEVLRNMINMGEYRAFPEKVENKDDDRKVISIIGRLSGPKGDVTYNILNLLYRRKDFKIRVIGGKDIPKRFNMFKNNVEFLGYVNNVSEKIRESDVVIGAGRVAVEAILCEVPVIAVGEAEFVGTLTPEKIESGLSSNFGDISLNGEKIFNWTDVLPEVEKSFSLGDEDLKKIKERVIDEFSLVKITDRIEKVYQSQYVHKKMYEMPVLMYHRVIKDESEKGVHGTYVTIKQFDKQMSYLKKKGFQTVTFEDLKNDGYKKRFNKENKWIMITFDDGYKDNYENALPILKKYGFKATIYILDGIGYNKWDTDNESNPEKKFPLMNADEIFKMKNEGIEFGGHTSSHPHLPTLEREQIDREILISKYNIEGLLGEKLNSFAYPYGELNDDVMEAMKIAGYEFAVSTDSGSVVFSDDLLRIRRIGIFPSNNIFNFSRKVSGKYNFIKIKREKQGGIS